MSSSNKCAFCDRTDALVTPAVDSPGDQVLLDVLRRFKENWKEADGVCQYCLNLAHEQLAHQLLDADSPETSPLKVLPTPLRLNASPYLTGKGITICFIDSGFYPHEDIADQILKVYDVTYPRRGKKYFTVPHDNAWHGTMTSVVCAGNGRASNGIYQGIAPDAKLVLLKTMDEDGKITYANILKALEWVVKHHKRYSIRVVNISVTADEEESYKESEMAKLLQRLYDAGVVVVAAAGNNPEAPLLPPASMPRVITVGGLNDKNTLDEFQRVLYHSTYGETVDDLQKPEIIAPAIWLAAPILPGTREQEEAKELFALLENGNGEEQEEALKQIRQRRLISAAYQQADGTSFAAPIVSSVIAQMLEANAGLTPSRIREALFSTARPLKEVDRSRIGYGVIQPGNAVAKILDDDHSEFTDRSPVIDLEASLLRFYFHHHDAEMVTLAGSFNEWSTTSVRLKPESDGFWTVELPLPTPGHYEYKYVIDQEVWTSDPLNFYRKADGYGDFNSQFWISD
ncbi:S8 family serine peptidase [Neolewinella persica]|uniref:S8 family serine peptidase n=1 Tax=Neolewinella persica TaxID=70998 RepID=UPI00037DC320|nr:S8 family serine peptidase [Neolewinella persica]